MESFQLTLKSNSFILSIVRTLREDQPLRPVVVNSSHSAEAPCSFETPVQLRPLLHLRPLTPCSVDTPVETPCSFETPDSLFS